MKAARLIREARRRARITQAELAARLGTKQPVIARWETGGRSPSFDTVQNAIRACGFEMESRLTPRDIDQDGTIKFWLRLTPKERVDRNRQMLETEAWARRGRVVDRKAVPADA
jgi:transcriptional regulator with XRE-family HTH domain